MNEPRREIVLQGVAASIGLALGRIAMQRLDRRPWRAPGKPAHEREDLRAAMAKAAAQLEALAESVGDRAAADMLEFQVALLADEDLIAPVFARIAAGAPADRAWRHAIDAEIAAYRTSGDEVLEGRTSDLADLRDRVLDALSPPAPPAAAADGEQGIYVAEELTPSRFSRPTGPAFAAPRSRAAASRATSLCSRGRAARRS
jgi:phosphoenolpyruvate-protein phosphotransferase (PTS system enzyme I)